MPKAPLEAVIAPAKAPRVRSLEFTDKAWYAATDQGLFVSVDQGRKWYGEPVEGESDFIVVNHFADGSVTLVSPKHIFLSKDEGASWTEISYPQYVTGLYNLTVGSRRFAVAGNARRCAALDRWRKDLAAPVSPVFRRTMCFPCAMTQPGSGCWPPRFLPTVFSRAKMADKAGSAPPIAGVSIRNALNYQGRLLGASSYNGLLLEQSSAVESASDAAHSGERTPPVSQP